MFWPVRKECVALKTVYRVFRALPAGESAPGAEKPVPVPAPVPAPAPTPGPAPAAEAKVGPAPATTKKAATGVTGPRPKREGKAVVGQKPRGRNGQPQKPPGLWDMAPFLVAVVLIFYFLIIRPESKRRKEREKKISALKVKDKVVTIGGIVGTIIELNADEVVLQVDSRKDVRLRLRRVAVEGPLASKESRK